MSRSIFKMRYLLVLTLFLFSQKFFAQISISGQVVNADKEAIEFANVYLKNTESGKIITGEISNEKGDFLLKTTETGSHTLTISFLGYEDWTKVLEVGSEDIKLGAIGLSSSASTMEEVVVTAEREVIEKKADRLVFNVEKSPLKTGFDGLEVLRRSPNILIDVNGEILMRKEVPTIMINGRISSLSGQELASYLRNLRSDDIQKIEVQTHLGVNTQSESSGGVINIILKKKPVGFTGNVTSYHAMAGGGFTRTSLGTNFNYGAEKWNVYGTLSYRFAETELTYDENILNYNREVSPNFIRNLHIWEESLATQNYKLGFVADPFKNHVFGFEGYVRVQNENVDNDGTISAEHNGTELDVGTADFDREQDNNLYNMTFNYSWKMDSINSQFNLFAEYLNKQTDGFSAANSVYQKGVFDNSAERFNSKVGTEIYSVQADFTKRFKKNLNLEMGLLATYIDRENDLLSDFLVNNEWVENERSNAFTYTEEIVGGYISMSKRFKEKNFFQIGLRLEDTKLERIELLDNSVIEQDYLNLFPSVYFSRDLKNGNSLSANFSRKFRRPDFYFLNNYVIKLNDFSFEQGNPDLRPEFVNKLQVSFNQSNQTTAAYFHKTTNAINPTYTLDGSVAFFQLKNIGERTQYGIEYNRFGNINKWWFIKGMVDVFYRYFTDDNGQNSFKTFAGYMTLSNTFKINKTTSFDISGEYESPHKDAFINKSYNYYIDLMLQKTFLDNQLTCRIYLFDVFHNWRHVDKRPFETFETNFNLRYRTRMLRLWVGYNFASKSKVSERKIQSKNDAKDRVW